MFIFIRTHLCSTPIKSPWRLLWLIAPMPPMSWIIVVYICIHYIFRFVYVYVCSYIYMQHPNEIAMAPAFIDWAYATDRLNQVIYICVYVYVNICVYIHMYMYICICKCSYACMQHPNEITMAPSVIDWTYFTDMLDIVEYICIYVYINVRIYICIYTYL